MLIATAVDTRYLTEERPRLADLIRAVTRCRHHRLRAPGDRTIERRVDAIDRKVIVARRTGGRTAQHLFGQVRTSPLNL